MYSIVDYRPIVGYITSGVLDYRPPQQRPYILALIEKITDVGAVVNNIV